MMATFVEIGVPSVKLRVQFPWGLHSSGANTFFFYLFSFEFWKLSLDRARVIT